MEKEAERDEKDEKQRGPEINEVGQGGGDRAQAIHIRKKWKEQPNRTENKTNLKEMEDMRLSRL